MEGVNLFEIPIDVSGRIFEKRKVLTTAFFESEK